MQSGVLRMQLIVQHTQPGGLHRQFSTLHVQFGRLHRQGRMGKLLDEIREKQLADELKNARRAKAWVKRMLAK